jgi:hypothetical protein
MNLNGAWIIRLGTVAGLLLTAILCAGNVAIGTYTGGSDTSAAVAVDANHFVIGDDEINILRVYAIGESAPVFSLNMTDFLGVDANRPEADIEGAARIGNRIYWVTSHGRNKEGQVRPGRYRFFATEITAAKSSADPNTSPRIVPIGKPYARLVQDMLVAPQLKALNLRAVTRLDEKLSKKERAVLAPKEGGLNIEGLAAGPDGRSLWIGLRNPQSKMADGKAGAIIIPLLNPEEVIENGKPARFGDAILLDLGGLGIRSMDYADSGGEYWIVAGESDSRPDFAVFRYRYAEKKLLPVKVAFPEGFTPEGLFLFPGQKTVWFVSDDGLLEKEVASPTECLPGQLVGNGRCPNKYLTDLKKRTFRVMRADLAD